LAWLYEPIRQVLPHAVRHAEPSENDDIIGSQADAIFLVCLAATTLGICRDTVCRVEEAAANGEGKASGIQAFRLLRQLMLPSTSGDLWASIRDVCFKISLPSAPFQDPRPALLTYLSKVQLISTAYGFTVPLEIVHATILSGLPDCYSELKARFLQRHHQSAFTTAELLHCIQSHFAGSLSRTAPAPMHHVAAVRPGLTPKYPPRNESSGGAQRGRDSFVRIHPRGDDTSRGGNAGRGSTHGGRGGVD